MSRPTTFRRLFFTTTVVALCAMAGALLAGRGLARRLAAERVAEVLVDAIPTQGLAACSAGNPQGTKVSERLEFAYYSVSGLPLSPGALPVPAPLMARIGEGRTAVSASNAEAKMLLRLDVTAGDCAFALATWRFQGQNRATAGGGLIAVLSVLLALLLGAGTVIAIRPLAAQLRELQRSARSLARPRTASSESNFIPPQVILEEAREVAQVLVEAEARIAETSASLRQRSEDLEALLGELTHDVRTPLASIQFALDEVAETAGAEALPALRRALSDVIYMKSLTSNLRLAERLQGGSPLGDAPIDVAELLSRTVERVEPFALRRGIELAAKIDPVLIRGDATALEQVFTNLLDNAVAYGDPGVHVRVRLAAGKFQIEDDGPGVSEEELPHLTTRSFRGNAAHSRPRDTKGSGLGLAIVREVCERSGWLLSFSRVPQGGLRVVIDFRAGAPSTL